MDCKILINCQYYENYNVGPDGFNTYGDGKPHWKPKGGHMFSMEMDSDALFYINDVEAQLSKIISNQSTVAEKFEYISHEIVWSEPTPLDSNLLLNPTGVEV